MDGAIRVPRREGSSGPAGTTPLGPPPTAPASAICPVWGPQDVVQFAAVIADADVELCMTSTGYMRMCSTSCVTRGIQYQLAVIVESETGAARITPWGATTSLVGLSRLAPGPLWRAASAVVARRPNWSELVSGHDSGYHWAAPIKLRGTSTCLGTGATGRARQIPRGRL